MPFSPFARLLDTNGDGTGNSNGAGNFSVTPATFFIRPGVGNRFILTTFAISISGSGSKWSLSDYGDITGGVTNGVNVQQVISGVTTDVFGTRRMRSNRDWLATFQELNSFSGNKTDDIFLKVITYFPTNSGDYLLLKDNDELRIILNDNFSTLMEHSFQVRGLRGI